MSDYTGIINIEALLGLQVVPDKSINCCVTSPPYYGLRNYNHAGQIGLEETPEAYIQKLVEIFREVKRVLRDDGTLWLNIGDSYWGGKGTSSQAYSTAMVGHRDTINGKQHQISGKGETRPTDRKHDIIKPKDLIGIPWMLAFALRQPYKVPTCVSNDIDKAWLAAMIDGEGCIGIRRYASYRKDVQQVYQDGFVVYLNVTNNDIELLERCIEITGKGKIYLKQKASSTDNRGIVSRRDSFSWRPEGNDAVDIIRAIYPYLIAKRKQACLAYTLDTINKNKQREDGKVPKEVQEKKVFLYESIKSCNQRENIIIPNWVEEPKVKIEDGWYLRQDIIWHKPNPMPESVTDRCTKSHEYIFLLSKSARYYYDADAIKENCVNGDPTNPRGSKGALSMNSGRRSTFGNRDGNLNGLHSGNKYTPLEKRNKRSVWTVNTKPFKGAHFATFPEKLIEPCILAGCPEGGIVLDPFGGAGTTAVVADKLKRKYLLFELNPDYAEMAENRVKTERAKRADLFNQD